MRCEIESAIIGHTAHVHHAGVYERATRASMCICAEMHPSKMSEIISWVQSLPFLCHRITGHLSYDTRVSEGSNRIRFLVVTATGTECRLPTQEFDSVVVANDRLSLRGYVIFPYSPIMRFCVSALTNHNGTIHRAKHVRCNSESFHSRPHSITGLTRHTLLSTE